MNNWNIEEGLQLLLDFASGHIKLEKDPAHPLFGRPVYAGTIQVCGRKYDIEDLGADACTRRFVLLSANTDVRWDRYFSVRCTNEREYLRAAQHPHIPDAWVWWILLKIKYDIEDMFAAICAGSDEPLPLNWACVLQALIERQDLEDLVYEPARHALRVWPHLYQARLEQIRLDPCTTSLTVILPHLLAACEADGLDIRKMVIKHGQYRCEAEPNMLEHDSYLTTIYAPSGNVIWRVHRGDGVLVYA